MARFKKHRKQLPPEARQRIEFSREVARQDMAIGLMSLFRPLRDGQKRLFIELQQQWNGGVVTVAGPELSAFDQSVLLSLLAASMRSQHAQSTTGAAIPALHCKGAAEQAQVICVRTSVGELQRLMGLHGDCSQSLRRAIRRLSSIVAEARAGDDWAQSHLISGAVGRGRASIEVTISWRLARAVAGLGSYAGVCLIERRALRSDLCKLIHAWLCAWLCSRAVGTIGLDSIISHLYASAPVSPRTARDRRMKVRAAIGELADAGWAVTWDGDTVTINRKHIETPLALPRKSASVAAPETTNHSFIASF